MQRGSGIVTLVVLLWLVIGAVAAGQRGYFGDDQDLTCKETGDTVLTILAGPLNYAGVNPKIDCDDLPDDLPEPSE